MKITAIVLCIASLACLTSFGEAEKEKPKPDAKAKPAAAAPTPEKKELGPWDGFRGIKWGTSVDEVKGLSKFREGDGVIAYHRGGESMQIGKAQAREIAYLFFERKLYAVFIHARGYDNCDKLHDVILERFGKPSSFSTSNNPSLHEEWNHEPNTDQSVSCTWEYLYAAEAANFTVTFEPSRLKGEHQKKAHEDAVVEKAAADAKAAAKEGAKKDF